MPKKSYKEALKDAKITADKVSVKLSDKTVKLPKETQKQAKEETPAKKNQLVEVPHKVDLAFQGAVRETDLEVDDPAHILTERLRTGEIKQEDLSVDDRFVIIRYMREEEGLPQDKIAEEIGVSRRTVINYCNKIKKLKATALADTDIWEMGGELYALGMKAMEQAVRTGKFKDFAYTLTSMISTLQSMGLIFKMPKQSQVQQQVLHELAEKKGKEGFKQIKHISNTEEVNLDTVFNELLGAVKDGKLDKEGDE